MTYIALTAKHHDLRKVRKRLRRRGLTAYVPCIVTKRIIPKGLNTRRKRKVVPLMNYVIVQAPAHNAVFDLWLHSIISTKGVAGYLNNDGRPAIIRSIEPLKEAVAKIRLEADAARHKAKLRRGDKAHIKSGSLAGKAGTVTWVRGKKAGLEAKLFGSMRVVEVPVEALEAA